MWALIFSPECFKCTHREARVVWWTPTDLWGSLLLFSWPTCKLKSRDRNTLAHECFSGQYRTVFDKLFTRKGNESDHLRHESWLVWMIFNADSIRTYNLADLVLFDESFQHYGLFDELLWIWWLSWKKKNKSMSTKDRKRLKQRFIKLQNTRRSTQTWIHKKGRKIRQWNKSGRGDWKWKGSKNDRKFKSGNARKKNPLQTKTRKDNTSTGINYHKLESNNTICHTWAALISL